jgi:hypothetical protein
VSLLSHRVVQVILRQYKEVAVKAAFQTSQKYVSEKFFKPFFRASLEHLVYNFICESPPKVVVWLLNRRVEELNKELVKKAEKRLEV